MTRYKEIVKEVKLYVAEAIMKERRHPLLYVLLDTTISTNYIFTMKINKLDEIPELMWNFLIQHKVPKKVPLTLHTFSDSEHTLPPIMPIDKDEFHSLEKILEKSDNFTLRENKYKVHKEKPKGRQMHLYRGW